MLRSALPFVALTAILLFASPSEAQNNAGGGAFGGASGFGGGGGGFGASGFGASNFGTSNFGASGFGGNGLGGGAFGGGQAGGQSAFGNNGTNGGTTYVGRGSETTFVGRGVGQANNNARFNQPRQTSGGGSGDSSSETNRRPPVRVRLRPSAELLAAARPAVDVSAASQRRSRMAGVTIETRAGVTVLEGVVDTPSQRLVAEKLAGLEPGVGAIENRLRLRSEAVELLPPPR